MEEKTPAQLRDEFWKEDCKNGGYIKNQYDEIKRVLGEKDFAWVQEKLSEIKKHAIEQTDFYKNYRVDDEFPVVNKMLILDNYYKFCAKGGFETPTHTSSTSGSTGTPFTVIQDYVKRKRNIADLKVFGELCDYPSHERMIFFRVLSDKLKRTKEQEDRENIYYIDSSDLGNEHLEEMKQSIIDKKPRIIFSYASTLVTLAEYIERTCKKSEVSVKVALTAGEGLSDENRRLLEKAFDCTVYRRYSDMELGILGQDKGNGSEYVLNFGSYYFECLKINSDEPAEFGEVGRIVITDLFNRAFPMIRYDTGDLGIMEKSDGFPILKEIYGRIRDCVYTTNGDLLSPAKISVSMWGYDEIKQWQFIQEAEKEYVFKLNCSKDFDSRDLINKFKGILGSDANLQVEFVDEIPVMSSNKRRAVVCNYIKK